MAVCIVIILNLIQFIYVWVPNNNNTNLSFILVFFFNTLIYFLRSSQNHFRYIGPLLHINTRETVIEWPIGKDPIQYEYTVNNEQVSFNT